MTTRRLNLAYPADEPSMGNGDEISPLPDSPSETTAVKKRRPSGTLKEAQAQLIDQAGGFVRAGDIGGKRKSQMARYSDTDEASHMPVDVVRRLETSVGDPVLTRFLAAEQGFVLLQVDERPARGGADRNMFALNRAFGDLLDPDQQDPGAKVRNIDQALALLSAMRSAAMCERPEAGDA